MKSVFTMSVLLLGLLLLGACNPVRPLPAGSGEPAATATAAAEAPASEDGSQGGVAANMVGVLANELGIDSSAVTVVSSEAVEWPDACLGVTSAGEMCAQVITPGYKIVLSANGNTYTYHTDQTGSTYRFTAVPEKQGGMITATARTALSWHLGPVPGDAGVCAHLTVLDNGNAYAEQRPCAGGDVVSLKQDRLSPEEQQQFDSWLSTYAPLYVDDNYLNSTGQEQMPDAETSAVETWSAALWTRISGMPLAETSADAPPASGETNTAAAAACGEAPAGGQIYSSTEYGFCILVPEGYEMVESAPGSLNIVAGGDLMNHTSPRVGIEVSAAGDRTLAGITDQMMADYVPVGTDVTSQTLTIDGDPAVLLDNLPGQDLNRRVVVKHNNLVYSLMFMPLSPEAEPLYQSVLASLHFVD
jgi:hypothetical protein